MLIRSTNSIGSASRFDAAAAGETLRELEEQYAAGEIEPHAYLAKKASLVRLFVKATTAPGRSRGEP